MNVYVLYGHGLPTLMTEAFAYLNYTFWVSPNPDTLSQCEFF